MSLRDIIGPVYVSPNELAQALGPDGTRVLLELIRDGYYDLWATHRVHKKMNENAITDQLVVHIEKVRRLSNRLSTIYINPQKEDTTNAKARGKPPTIDISFQAEWPGNLYFGAECKLVEANNKRLCDEYIWNGLARYLDGRYGSEFPEGAMIAYIFASKCEAVANEVRTRMRQLEGSPSLDRSENLLPFQDYHMSHHPRQSSSTPSIIIHHLLFSF